jgi:hypothetical protein
MTMSIAAESFWHLVILVLTALAAAALIWFYVLVASYIAF